ncbi:pentapeptide repeat-containing protein [Sneathiella sp. HT1-7]|uniref:pentapeptide repeat-containing protein n=1 Tax=Sneathiella sp. HT1-7 TaxID=2887192 RepID=UPI001D13C0CF|nr:pentapeptide repeat-containing protein [Sneathiella sp. HT1-7]MCC3305998.1 pentapeptide repeat-containing protein [Sneathiella sp. HT1-7]
MADEEEKKILPKEEALALARKGKDAWNRWAAENPGIKVDFSGHDFSQEDISFAGFKFPGDVDFSETIIADANFINAEFSGGDANFHGAKFSSGDANFTATEFSGGDANFTATEFSGGDANFIAAEFSGGQAYFTATKFSGGNAYFSEAEFSGGNANFTATKFSGGNAYFSEAEFSGGNAFFAKADFSGGVAEFWIADFSGGNASFYGAKFSGGDANFTAAKFSGGDANFTAAKFSGGDASFVEAEFSGGKADFEGVEFKKESYFREATFEHQSTFQGANFSGPVDLEGSRFAGAPDFRRSTMTAHFTLHDMKVGYTTHPKKIWGIFKKASTSIDTDKFRRLKELAVYARDHEREQDFFAKELKAKRFYEGFSAKPPYNTEWARKFISKNLGYLFRFLLIFRSLLAFISLLPNYLYEWTSDFGRSLWRPALCLGLTWLIFGLLYGVNGLKYAPSPLEPLWNGLKLSLATLVPFAAISRTAMLEAREALFRSDVNHLLDFAMVFEGILAVAFIFLIGLALRNRFRI